jgi:hypothetical protein
MNKTEIAQKITGLAKILQDSDIIQRCRKLAEKGKKTVDEGRFNTHITYNYLFKSNEGNVLNIIINYGYNMDPKKYIEIMYNKNKVLDAVSCDSDIVPKEGFELTNEYFGHYSENVNELFIYAKQSGTSYKISKYQKGEWEELVSRIEKGTAQEYKEPEAVKPEPEIDEYYVKLLKNNFNL